MPEYISRETAISALRLVEVAEASINIPAAMLTELKAIPAADVVERPRWISVTERLPEKNVRVLCACRANIFCVMKWDGVDWYENPTHVFMRGFVTHWMSLPEPPKEDA